MKYTRTLLPTFVLITTLLLAACQPGASTPAAQLPPASAPSTEEALQDDSQVVDKPTEEAMQESSPESAAVEEEAANEALADLPEWFNIALTDVNSGETFTFADFKGQIVLVEQMAAWCTNCLAQQRELVELHSQIGDAAISIAIDVDLNENEDILRRHAESRGFDWRYAIATPELIQAFVDEFGASVLNPPSVPMFLIDKEGGVHLLDFGHKTVAYLTGQIQTYQ